MGDNYPLERVQRALATCQHVTGLNYLHKVVLDETFFAVI
jgi:hypothetical protein